jgi:hypothetical protein
MLVICTAAHTMDKNEQLNVLKPNDYFPMTPLNYSLSTGMIGFDDSFVIQENMLNTFHIANIIHEAFDKKLDDYENWYHGHYAGGVNPYYSQTKNNILIIEGYYNSLASQIHTPLGYLSIGGSASGDASATNTAILNDDRIKLKLICPGYQTKWGYHGGWYLVTELNGKILLNADILPDFEDDPERNYDKSDSDFNLVILPRIRILQSFYKDEREYIDYEESKKKFNDILCTALHEQILGDKYNISLRAITATKNSEVLDNILNDFIEKSEDKRNGSYIEFRRKDIKDVKEWLLDDLSDKRCDRLLSLIYNNHLTKPLPTRSW